MFQHKTLPLFLFFALLMLAFKPWGFYSHKKINRLAVYSLPTEMIGFYKKNIEVITENAVNADERRYAIKEEAARHYIDLDVYSDSVQKLLPTLSWKQATERFTEDTLQSYGIVPWHIVAMKFRLEKAFREKNTKQILLLSADLGHYIADANVPLHTTENYNGQLTNQVGIHAFWESRLPELFSDEYELLVGQATYVEHPQERAWQTILQAHAALDSVLLFEKELSLKFPEDKKYTIEERNGQTIRIYSKEFSEKYNAMLNGQVERQMKNAVKTIADFWFTAWVDAGQPDLKKFKAYDPNDDSAETVKKPWFQRLFQRREEADN